jgi:hypothetical protein
VRARPSRTRAATTATTAILTPPLLLLLLAVDWAQLQNEALRVGKEVKEISE